MQKQFIISVPEKGDLLFFNVAGLDDNMFSDVLFGHTKDAFTGANKARLGLVERAAGGLSAWMR